jgi:hypothetical protein
MAVVAVVAVQVVRLPAQTVVLVAAVVVLELGVRLE